MESATTSGEMASERYCWSSPNASATFGSFATPFTGCSSTFGAL